MSDPTLDHFTGLLVPPALDRTKVSDRREPVLKAVASSSLRVSRMFESGSWSHGTAIAGKSDVDFIAVATATRPLAPSSALQAAKNSITGCGRRIRSVTTSSPVVAVRYYDPPDFEIAPAWFKETRRGYDVYWIGGRSDEWVESAPKAHLDYVNEQNDRLNKKVKPLVRLLKAWKLHVSAPVSSFYLEMRAAKYAAGEASIVYDLDLRSVMDQLAYSGVPAMNDPKGIVGRIPATASEEKRRLAVRQLGAAVTKLLEADAAKDRGDRSAYRRAMSDVFGTNYPWPTW